MMRQKIILGLVILLALAPLVLAEESFLFKQGESPTIEIPVFENDITKCTTCTCTITIEDPDGKNMIRGASTNMSDNYAVYNLNETLTETQGVYTGDVHCSNGADSGAATFEYNVTPSGFTGTIGFYFFIITLSFLVMGLGFWIKDPWTVIFGTFGLYFVGLYIWLYGIIGIKDNTTTFAVGLITLGIAGYISIRSAMETIN